MKLRIKGDSLRLRVSRSELDRVLRGHTVAETIHFTDDPGATLTYALVAADQSLPVRVLYEARLASVLLSRQALQKWASPEEVGVYALLTLGAEQTLDVAVEKDFACLDRDDADNEDTFANPKSGQSC